MTQREFNKEVIEQFEMMWGIFGCGMYLPSIRFHCDKRTNGKRRRIFKTNVSYISTLAAEYQQTTRKIWEVIAKQTGWKVVEGNDLRGRLQYIGLANWR